jgi:hypothetical protein
LLNEIDREIVEHRDNEVSPYVVTVSHIIMQNPTDQAETSIATETVMAIKCPNLNPTFTVRRKGTKRALPWSLTSRVIGAPSSILARKKPRLEVEPLPTTSDARKTTSPEIAVGLPPPFADNDDDTNADSVTDTQSNPRATQLTGRWTSEENAKLTDAVTNTCKKKHGKELNIDWFTIASLVPSRTRAQCCNRWQSLDPNIDRAIGRTGISWTADEDIKLKASVQTHGGKN